MGDTSSSGAGAYAPANYIAFTADVTTPASGDTTLTGELTGGTMGRARATYAHTSGQATYTLTISLTADRIVTVAKMGAFTASSGGTLVFETLLDSTAPMRVGDQIQVVQTVSL